MKQLQEFRNLVEEEKSDYSKFDILVRAGLANKAQLARLHRIMDKMGEEKPVLNNADREIMRNLFNRMAELITSNKQIFTKARQAVKEEIEEGVLDTADYKVGPSGRKVRAHRIKVGDVGEVKENFELTEAPVDFDNDPPFVLVLKRRAIRMYPDKTKVALYYSKTLDKYFSVPYGGPLGAVVQAEETQIEEAVHGIDQLKKIRDSKQHGVVNHRDGSATKVDSFTASAILAVHDKVNDANKKKINDMVSNSHYHLNKVAGFALSKTK